MEEPKPQTSPEAAPTPQPHHQKAAAKAADKFLHGKGIFTFLRSSVSSQIASWIDMGVCFCFYAWVFNAMGTAPMRSFLSTAIGLVAGGTVNCIVNYRFTFQAKGCSIKAVAVKYLLVWAGSFVLNLVGTTVVTHVLQSLTWLEKIGFRPDGIFATARLAVSLAVSLAWNFVLQKNFVYRPSRFDPYAVRFLNWLTLAGTRRRRKLRRTS